MRMPDKQMAIAVLPETENTRGMPQSPSFGGHGALITRLFLAGGLLLFGLLLWRTGLDAIGLLLWKASWAFPLVFIPYALVLFCETWGWWFTFPSSRTVHLTHLLRLTIAAKGVQFLTPSIIQAGEFMKIHLLRQSGVTADLAVASIVVAKTTIMMSEVLFIAAGLSWALAYVAIEPSVAASVLLGVLAMCLCVMGAVLLQRAGLFRPLVWVSRHTRLLGEFIARHEAFLSSTEQMIQSHLQEKRRFVLSCLWFFMGWAAGIVEVCVLLSILGLPSDPATALVIHVWSLIVTRLTTFIPGNLGAQEAGIVMTFSLLGLPAEGAMAFAVLRRIRQLGWIAASLVCLRHLSRDQRVGEGI